MIHGGPLFESELLTLERLYAKTFSWDRLQPYVSSFLEKKDNTER